MLMLKALCYKVVVVVCQRSHIVRLCHQPASLLCPHKVKLLSSDLTPVLPTQPERIIITHSFHLVPAEMSSVTPVIEEVDFSFFFVSWHLDKICGIFFPTESEVVSSFFFSVQSVSLASRHQFLGLSFHEVMYWLAAVMSCMLALCDGTKTFSWLAALTARRPLWQEVQGDESID